MCTFSDGAPALALESFKASKIHIESHAKFNNSVMFKKDPERKWFDFGLEQYSNFENQIMKQGKLPVSTQDSVLVIETRDNIVATSMQCRTNQTVLGLNIMTLKENIQDVVSKCKSIDQNKNYVHTWTSKVMESYPVDHNVTQCKTCAGNPDKNYGICHKVCVFGNDAEKEHCAAMRNGVCTLCGCPWFHHENVHIDYHEVTKTHTSEDEGKKEIFEA